MKYHNLLLVELSVSEVLNLEPDAQLLVYNPFSETYHLEFADDNCSAKRTFRIGSLRYFLFSIGELPKK